MSQAFRLETKGFEELFKKLEAASVNIAKDANTVANATAKWVKSQIAKKVQETVKIPQKLIKKGIVVKRGPTSMARTVVVNGSFRIPLEQFGPTQDATGVTAQIAQAGVLARYPGGFMGPKPGQVGIKLRGKAFRREGKSRLPIRKLTGPSVMGVVLANKMLDALVVDASARLVYEMERRIRFLNLKQTGDLNWQDPSYVSDQATGEN